MILVFVETEDGAAGETSLETLAFTRALSDEIGGVPIRAVVIGDVADPAALAAELGAHGADEMHHAVGEAFAAYSGAAWGSAVQQLAEATESDVITAAGTPRGNEVLAHVAARLEVPMAANVVGFESVDPFIVTRQVVGGSALEEMQLYPQPAIFSVAGHSWAAATVDGAGPAELIEQQPVIDDADLVARVRSTGVKEADHSDSLKSAKVVVGAGRGAGGPNGFDAVVALAELLGGSVGVSRVVTSLGWRPHHEQVGQTGSRISPDIYIPCGISGAIQHWAGCSSSKTILAINTDDEAPMMTKATYAVVGDMHEVLPAVIAELESRR